MLISPSSQKSWKQIEERILTYAITVRTGLVSWGMVLPDVKRKAVISPSILSNEDVKRITIKIIYLSELCKKLLTH